MKNLIILLIIQISLFQVDSTSLDTAIIQQPKEENIVPETIRVITRYENPEVNFSEHIENTIKSLFHNSFTSIWRIILSALILFLVGYLNFRMNKFYGRYHLSSRLKNGDLIKLLVQLSLWFLTFLFILFILLKTSILLVSFLIIFIFLVLLLAIGDIARNAIGGLIVITENAFRPGDWIKVGDYTGKVMSKNLLSTEMITEDDSLIKIPNQFFISKAFENLNVISKNKQVSFVVEVSSKSEISKIKSSIEEIVSLSIYNSINRPVEVFFRGLNQKGNPEFQVKAYVFDAKYENEFKSDVLENVANLFGIVKYSI